MLWIVTVLMRREVISGPCSIQALYVHRVTVHKNLVKRIWKFKWNGRLSAVDVDAVSLLVPKHDSRREASGRHVVVASVGTTQVKLCRRVIRSCGSSRAQLGPVRTWKLFWLISFHHARLFTFDMFDSPTIKKLNVVQKSLNVEVR